MRTNKWSGIQKKYLCNTLILLILALLLSSIGVWIYVRKNMTSVVVDKYRFMTEKMGISLDILYQKSEEITAECIINEKVQKSLKTQELETVEKSTLSKYFAYIELNGIKEYCYVDNKQNIYTKSYSNISYEDFEESGFAEMLLDSYAKTEWFIRKDTLFQTPALALFIGRNVRSLDYAHMPGMLFFKMDDSFLQSIVEDEEALKDTAMGIVDNQGRICMEYYPDNYTLSTSDEREIIRLSQEEVPGRLSESYEISGGILQAYRQKETGFTVFTLVPDEVLSDGFMQIFLVLAGIYLMVIFFAVGISIYISKIFTKPIQMISRQMESFDGKDFSHKLNIRTNTELDKIGDSYNGMLVNIESLLKEVKKQEKELRTSELNMLLSQINPHFLYNTLDTIYMLARINGEETTMKMIHALSGYLRLSLSKGSDIVTVADELENVRYYLEIQQIRNADLFTYEIDCQVEKEKRYVLKLILQPLVENAIKYGFSEMQEGGIIRICVKETEGRLSFSVFNNGSPMEKACAEKINDAVKMPVMRLKELFPDKRHGYGVTNIVTRLRLKYGEEVVFKYVAEKEGTTCVIILPDEGKYPEEP